MKTIEEYLQLPYTIEMIRQSNQSWFVSIKELPGCMSQGDTPEEAVAMIHDAMRAWVEVALEDGYPIPEPQSDEDYSGRFVVRVPRGLHRQLVLTADLQEVSLNAYCIAVLAQSVGQPAVVKRDFSGLADAVERLLKGASVDINEEKSLEENFAEWMSCEIDGVEALLQNEKTEEALSELTYLSKGLQKAGKKSPLFESMAVLIAFFTQKLRAQFTTNIYQPVEQTRTFSSAKIPSYPESNEKQIKTIGEEKNRDYQVNQFIVNPANKRK
jgi:antitoxin HicB